MEATSVSWPLDPEGVPSLWSLPPPPETAEEGLEPAIPVQLINQTSHLTLSIAGEEPEASRGKNAASYQLPDGDNPPTPPMFATSSAAQSCLEMGGGCSASSPAGDIPRSACHDGVGDTMTIDQQPEREPSKARFPKTCSNQNQTTAITWVAGHSPVTPRDPDPDAMYLSIVSSTTDAARQLCDLPTEVLLHILGYLDVSDLLATSRTCHLLRALSLAPILHHLRLRRTRAILPPMLASPSRPSLADLIRRSIFMTHTTVVSRKLARSLASIRLSRRLAARPSAEVLVERCVLPRECLPGKGPDGSGMVAPALVARKRAVERERVKDGLRRWVGSVWRGEVQTREEGVRRWEERVGVGRVWRMRRFWERMSGAVGSSSTGGAGAGDDRGHV